MASRRVRRGARATSSQAARRVRRGHVAPHHRPRATCGETSSQAARRVRKGHVAPHHRPRAPAARAQGTRVTSSQAARPQPSQWATTTLAGSKGSCASTCPVSPGSHLWPKVFIPPEEGASEPPRPERRRHLPRAGPGTEGRAPAGTGRRLWESPRPAATLRDRGGPGDRGVSAHYQPSPGASVPGHTPAQTSDSVTHVRPASKPHCSSLSGTTAHPFLLPVRPTRPPFLFI
ncbi:hypothetical protein NDU88_009170 [Pleurodeles waltl]|uniref:Uncharacterized protein n=1 Tax=Pleurodeles waltl TaxID=8319 RepID=A0AAV7P164_PLEWA|nr:hypothetical protein NDU88_009170 [Pleurodeles waltl]